MQKWDKIASIVGIALGFFLSFFSYRLNIGHLNEPGPGFMPFVTGIVLLIMSIFYGLTSTWTRDENYRKQESPWPRQNLSKLIGVLAVLFLFAIFIDILGYILSTFLLMIYLFRVVEPEKWVITIVKATLSVLITYLIFDKWLMIQFPIGLLGI